ncbi:hypothetical protein [Clostridium sp.]|uniref:hypothetical protein n=1 Tax=Clostridium sp. TaxID=1506 RepID=UPI00283E455B|nr:hypothetical protein [Clostridium sp.]MDR3595126.1 hypothetical protein [Clostridium sp.]
MNPREMLNTILLDLYKVNSDNKPSLNIAHKIGDDDKIGLYTSKAIDFGKENSYLTVIRASMGESLCCILPDGIEYVEKYLLTK